MSAALAVITRLLQQKADWRNHCLACEGPPEVYISGLNLWFFFCKSCTSVHLDALLNGSYRIVGGHDAQAYAIQRAEQKMG